MFVPDCDEPSITSWDYLEPPPHHQSVWVGRGLLRGVVVGYYTDDLHLTQRVLKLLRHKWNKF